MCRNGKQRCLPFFLCLVLCATALTGCADRYRLIEDLAARNSWTNEVFTAGGFHVSGYLRPGAVAGGALPVYLEGDGRAFISRRRVSSDPTPDDPTAFRLAIRHPAGAVLYLARPCQYARDDLGRSCDLRYWTTHRYAPEIVNAVDAAIDSAKRATGAATIALYGYSGGGVVAALIAARRRDVDRLVTIGANLDHEAWTRGQGLTPLIGSLDPADRVADLAGLAQVHFVGAEDTVVPPYVVESFAGGFPPARWPEVRVIAGYDHFCCWVEAWPDLLATLQAR